MKIKFRVWDKINKKMYYPDSVLGINEPEFFVSQDGNIVKELFSEYDNVIDEHYDYMQEIQLYQTKMYVGDIVDVIIDGYLDMGGATFDTELPETYRGIICYKNYAFGVDLGEGVFMYLSTIECDEIEDIIVVGNIYEDNRIMQGKE